MITIKPNLCKKVLKKLQNLWWVYQICLWKYLMFRNRLVIYWILVKYHSKYRVINSINSIKIWIMVKTSLVTIFICHHFKQPDPKTLVYQVLCKNLLPYNPLRIFKFQTLKIHCCNLVVKTIFQMHSFNNHKLQPYQDYPITWFINRFNH